MRAGFLLSLFGLVAILGCASPEPTEPAQPTSTAAPVATAPPSPPSSRDVYVPEPDMTDMEDQVAQRFREARDAVLASSLSAAAWGEFGMVAHAHELWDEARVSYERAESLDPSDPRWPYFLGDVLSVTGTDLGASADAFSRAMKLRADYAPAHMRLGRVLLAADRQIEAERQFERALELEPELQPAKVALAQIRLAQGRFDVAEGLLEKVLASSPRHAQALSTLGQVYMRQGRRDEAREVATRARDAALYNLFTDPLMGEVVNEGVSSVLVWERAKAFYDNGNFKQAALGLEKVVKHSPSNVEARHQLAIAYSNLGLPQRSKPHLERVIALDDTMIDARVQLATIHLDEQNPNAAIPLLRSALALDSQDPDAGWLLGRAQVVTGQVEAALATFAKSELTSSVSGASVPGWAHNEWGSALAQSGRLQEAKERFEKALAVNPNDAQALFYLGLVHEGMGQLALAIDFHCRSMKAQPNPPASGRLAALGRTCP